MFGRVTSVQNNLVTLENIKKQVISNLLNCHVVFDEPNRKIVGEVIAISEEEVTVLLVGEITNNAFNPGILKKPAFISAPRIIYKSELEIILGSQQDNINSILIGESTTYTGFKLSLDINAFFSSHFAIIGNTGSGKSCGIARLFQNLFLNSNAVPQNAHILLFDVYGEYNSAFKNFNNYPPLKYKTYTTQLNFPDAEIIKIPPYLLEADDLALLLDATDSSQMPVIERAIKLVRIFTSKDEKIVGYKNDIIAKALLDVLSSGKSSTQIRDQIIAVLSYYNTPTLNLDSIIAQPGYNRTLKQCLNIDAQGKMNAVSFVADMLQEFAKVDLDDIELSDTQTYTLKDLYYAFEFALISEGSLTNEVAFNRANTLKIRLNNLITDDYAAYFDVSEFISKADWVKNVFTVNNQACQIVNMNLNYIDDRFAKLLTKIISKFCFDFGISLKERASFPIHIVLEEAHRYVQNDNDINIIGYNVFDRITKEGRKYGTILGLISQRPSELSNTALSQCSNFFVFRMYHPDDIRIISKISSNVTEDTIEKIKTLSPGTAMLFGTAVKLPTIVKLAMPEPKPQSTSVDIYQTWYS